MNFAQGDLMMLGGFFALTASASNLTDEPLVTLRYGSATPGHACRNARTPSQ